MERRVRKAGHANLNLIKYILLPSQNQSKIVNQREISFHGHNSVPKSKQNFSEEFSKVKNNLQMHIVLGSSAQNQMKVSLIQSSIYKDKIIT
jgi:hypothetical protein